jgi:hypothetical protein
LHGNNITAARGHQPVERIKAGLLLQNVTNYNQRDFAGNGGLHRLRYAAVRLVAQGVDLQSRELGEEEIGWMFVGSDREVKLQTKRKGEGGKHKERKKNEKKSRHTILSISVTSSGKRCRQSSVTGGKNSKHAWEMIHEQQFRNKCVRNMANYIR